jgi:ArsR family transcriptional regulator
MSSGRPILTEDHFALIAKALADPRRYDILKRIASSPAATPCGQLLQCFDIVPATLSHHMKELESAGLIRSERVGKFVQYSPRTAVISAYLRRVRGDLL